MADTQRPLRAGDRALVQRVRGSSVVEVIEERGPLGVGGPRHLLIRLCDPCADPIEMEWPEDEMTLVEPAG